MTTTTQTTTESSETEHDAEIAAGHECPPIVWPTEAALSEAAEIDWGAVEDYYPEDEAVARRDQWDSDGCAWQEEIDSAIAAIHRRDRVAAAAHIKAAGNIESDWGAQPGTDSVARLLGLLA